MSARRASTPSTIATNSAVPPNSRASRRPAAATSRSIAAAAAAKAAGDLVSVECCGSAKGGLDIATAALIAWVGWYRQVGTGTCAGPLPRHACPQTTENRMRAAALPLLAAIGLGLLAGCANDSQPVSQSAPSVSYRVPSNNDVSQANADAARYCQQYNTGAQLQSIQPGPSGNVAVYSCTGTPGAVAGSIGAPASPASGYAQPGYPPPGYAPQ